MAEISHVGIIYIAHGDEDPTVAGFAAPIGSIFHRLTGHTYKKTGPEDTDWDGIVNLGEIDLSNGNLVLKTTGTLKGIILEGSNSVDGPQFEFFENKTEPDVDDIIANLKFQAYDHATTPVKQVYGHIRLIHENIGDGSEQAKWQWYMMRSGIANNLAMTLDGEGNLWVDKSILLDASETVDGRDLSVDGTKLDGIATGAQVATKEFFISAGAAILSSNASYPIPNNTYHLALADAVSFARCFFVFRLPTDFSSMVAGYPKVAFKQGTGGTGNYRIAFEGRNGGIGEQLSNELDSIAEYTMAAPGSTDEIWEEDISANFDGLSLAAGDYVGLQIQRDSDDVLDTFAGDLDVLGIVVKYS